VHAQTLLQRNSVFSTGMALLPTTERKPLSTPSPKPVPAHGTTQVQTVGQGIDLFRVQHVANKLHKHGQNIEISSENGTKITQIVQSTILSNIIPLQQKILERNRNIISNIPGAEYNTSYIGINQAKNNAVSFLSRLNSALLSGGGGGEDDSGARSEQMGEKITERELSQYSTTLNSIAHASGLIQYCKQILSIKQQELHQLKQFRIQRNNDHLDDPKSNQNDAKNQNNNNLRPLQRTFTRLELWQQNLNTTIVTQQHTHSSVQINSLLSQIRPILHKLLENKAQISTLESKMSQHILHKTLPIVYAQISKQDQLYKSLLSPLRLILDEYNTLSQNNSQNTHNYPIPSASNPQIDHQISVNNPPTPLTSLPTLAFSTIEKLTEQFNDFFVNNSSNKQKTTPNTSIHKLLSSNQPLTDEYLSHFKTPIDGNTGMNKNRNNIPQNGQNLETKNLFLSPKFQTTFQTFLQNDDQYDNMSIQIASLYSQQLELLPQFIPLARQLEELCDIPAFEPDKLLIISTLPQTPPKSSFLYHSSSTSPIQTPKLHDTKSISIKQQQQIAQFITQLHFSAKQQSLDSFETNIFQKEMSIFLDMIQILEQSSTQITKSLPSHIVEHYIRAKKRELDREMDNGVSKEIKNDQNSLLFEENDSILTPINSSGEYIYHGRKWDDIAKDNMYTHLTNYELLQQKISNFHTKQEIELEHIVEQQLSSANHGNAIQNDDISSSFQLKLEQQSQLKFLQVAEQVQNIQKDLTKLIAKPNTILHISDSKSKKGNNFDVDDAGGKTHPGGALLDDFPLHTLKAKKATTPVSSIPIVPSSTVDENTDTQINLDKQSTMIDIYSPDVVEANAQISTLLNTHSSLMKQYENQNKSHAFSHSRTLNPTIPYYTNAYALDIDGVLLKDGHLIPGVKETLHTLFPTTHGGTNTAVPIPTVFMTNGGGMTEAAKAKELSEKFGLKISPEQVIVSTTPWRSLVPIIGDKNIAIIGGKQSPAVAKEYGFKNSFPINDLKEQFCDLVAPQAIQDNQQYYSNLNSNLNRTKRTLGNVDALMIWTDPRDWYVDLQVSLDILLLSRQQSAQDLQIPIGTYKNRKNILMLNNWKDISENAHIEDDCFQTLSLTIPHNFGSQNSSISLLTAPQLPHQSNNPNDYFSLPQLYYRDYKPLHTPVLLSNPDFIYSNRYDTPRLAQGSFAEALSYFYTRLTGEPLEFMTCGKPTQMTYRYAEGKLLQQARNLIVNNDGSAGSLSTSGSSPSTITNTQRPVVISNIYGVGDNPSADIKGANGAGEPWTSVFVHTGTIPRDFTVKLMGSTGIKPHFGNNNNKKNNLKNNKNYEQTEQAQIDEFSSLSLIEREAEKPQLEYPSVCEAIQELEQIHKNVMGQLSLKL
jgi:HAD superfamily hydrolase (TIGR01450 family)